MNAQRIMTKKYAVPVIALLCTLLWGSAPPVIKLAYRESVFNVAGSDIKAQILMAGLRFLCAGVLLLAFGFFSSGKKMLPTKNDVKPILILAVIQTSLHYLFTFIGVAHTTATKAAILTASSAFFSVILAPLFFKNERLTTLSIVGSVVGFSGIICINFDKGEMGGFSLLGEGFILFAAICYVAGNFISKSVAQKRSAMMLNGWQMLLGGAVLSAVGLAIGGRLNFANYRCFVVLIYLGAVSAVAFTLWTMLLVYNPAGKVGIYNLMIPVFSTVFSGVLLKESIFTAVNLLSMLLVCAGIALVNKKSLSRASMEI